MNISKKELCYMRPTTLAHGSARENRQTRSAKKNEARFESRTIRIVKLITETTRKGWLVLKRPYVAGSESTL